VKQGDAGYRDNAAEFQNRPIEIPSRTQNDGARDICCASRPRLLIGVSVIMLSTEEGLRSQRSALKYPVGATGNPRASPLWSRHPW
jgi:hypothetical protein